MILLRGEDVEMRRASVTSMYNIQCTYVHERILRDRERYLHVFVVSSKYLHEGEIAAAKGTA